APSPAELLAVWERGLSQSAGQRALSLLAWACSEETPEALARLSIGRRDGRLLQLRECLFGAQLASVVDCPACHAQLGVTFNVADLLVPPVAEPPGPFPLDSGDYSIEFRLPTTLDMARLPESGDAAGARRQLLGSCLSSAKRGQQAITANDLPEEV